MTFPSMMSQNLKQNFSPQCVGKDIKQTEKLK